MNINGKPFQTIWLDPDQPFKVKIIDQRYLPHELVIEDISCVDEMALAIKDMHVRGAGLIGACAGFGIYLAACAAPRSSIESFMKKIQESGYLLKSTRPTAINLEWAVNRVIHAVQQAPEIYDKMEAARIAALEIAAEDVSNCRRIGRHGIELIRDIHQRKNGETVHILTHCNAGWLAFVDYGTATAPIYEAFDSGIGVHVYVDETRPRNQGAQLTAYELGQHGVPHTIITDNAGGHLMQHGKIDMVIVGSDRTTSQGDVANKVGTYLKALAAKANGIPFYVALPSSSIDWRIVDGLMEITIEERDGAEIKYISGVTKNGTLETVLIAPMDSPALNIAFDVTPHDLITGLVTERGICPATTEGLLSLFPERIFLDGACGD